MILCKKNSLIGQTDRGRDSESETISSSSLETKRPRIRIGWSFAENSLFPRRTRRFDLPGSRFPPLAFQNNRVQPGPDFKTKCGAALTILLLD